MGSGVSGVANKTRFHRVPFEKIKGSQELCSCMKTTFSTRLNALVPPKLLIFFSSSTFKQAVVFIEKNCF